MAKVENHKYQAFILSALIFIALIQIGLVPTLHVEAQQVYEYYGYIPEFFNFTDPLDAPFPTPTSQDPNPGWRINGTAYIDIVGYNDSTKVIVYDISLPDQPRLLVQGTVNRMGLYSYRLPKDYYFKVVSDKPVAVGIEGGTMYNVPSIQAGTTGFYPSTDGGFAGKEFIFMAFPAEMLDEPEPAVNTVHAVEDAHVTIYDSSGRVVWEKDVAANSSRSGIILPSRLVYRAVSTGRIMIANWVGHSWTALPNAFGGYAGTRFFTKENAATHGMNEWVSLTVIGQSSAATVKVLDPVGGKTFGQSSVEPRKMWYAVEPDLPFKKQNTVITSTAPVIAFVGDVESAGDPEAGNMLTMRDAVTFFGVRANEPTTFYIISKGVIFSPEANARVIMGTVTLDIKKGGYASLPSGLITLSSNVTLIIEAISARPSYYWGGWGGAAHTNFGAYLITPYTVNIVYPPAKEAGGGLPLYQIGAVVGVVAIVAIFLVWKKPWKSS